MRLQTTSAVPFILPIILLLMSALVSRAQFTFTTNNGAALITGYTGPGGAVAIPSQINGLPVTGIDTYAFANAFNVTNISIPGSVTTIGFGAFYECGNLTSITIPSSVTTIGEQTFYYCGSLTNVTLSSSLRSIAAALFFYCQKLTTVSIPNSVTNIGESAFFECASLPAISIPDAVESIGPNAFGECHGLTNISIPASVNQIAGDSFYACSGLNALSVDSQNPSYTSKDGVVFSKDLSLLVAFPPGKSGSYAVPAGVKSIGEYAFATCRNITNLFLADGITNLGYWSFSQCDGISRITIPRSVQQIGDLAFQDCARLSEVFFQGDAPAISGYGARLFPGSSLYYLPGTTGWGPFFSFLNSFGILWNPTLHVNHENAGPGTNRFGLNLTGTADIPFVIEATTNLFGSPWIQLQSGTLTNGSLNLSDLQSANSPQCFYRVRSP